MIWMEIGHTYSSGYTTWTKIRQTKKITDTVAVRFARHAMGVAAYGHFKEVPPSWAAFVKVLEARFMPSDIKNRLTEELGRLKMDGDDFSRYFP